MLSWVFTFLILAIAAGFLGFGTIAGVSISIAKILFFIFLIGLAVSLIMYLMRDKK